MAKKGLIKDRATKDIMYPITTPKCILLEDGRTLEEWMKDIENRTNG